MVDGVDRRLKRYGRGGVEASRMHSVRVRHTRVPRIALVRALPERVTELPAPQHEHLAIALHNANTTSQPRASYLIRSVRKATCAVGAAAPVKVVALARLPVEALGFVVTDFAASEARYL